jgi:hypothetical protein
MNNKVITSLHSDNNKTQGENDMNNEQPWISVYDASIALECTLDEIQHGIDIGDIKAIQATKKRHVYWKVIDAKVIEAFQELNMEIMYEHRRTERFSRYCQRWMSDADKACAMEVRDDNNA